MNSPTVRGASPLCHVGAQLEGKPQYKKIEATKSNSQILSQFLNEQLRMAKKARYPSAEDLI